MRLPAVWVVGCAVTTSCEAVIVTGPANVELRLALVPFEGLVIENV